ncbi:MAG: 2,3-bisphosphoglycerate-independent phosphoglycerate mutase [Deltaproteobacteria bacterium]|nr:2,3-bisphosphoglycerate-independent phosphoglycerate mutase [Deltaproteobacteria bacterium]
MIYLRGSVPLSKQPVALIIMDGWGLAEAGPGNAVSQALTPVYSRLLKECPWTTLGASALDVGLPPGQMGNSEVGHTNIGAGRIVYQELTRISRALVDGSLADNGVLQKAFQAAAGKGKSLHLLGLLSDGGVHSHQDHLEALLQLAAERGLERVYVHAFLDGRDTPPASGLKYVRRLQAFLQKLGCGRIASLGGRFYGMDRDQRWDRVERCWRTLVLGEGERFSDAAQAVESSYAHQVFDEFVEPLLITAEGQELPLIREGDALIFFNFRGDRAREITMALTADDFQGFARPYFPRLGVYVCMTEYDADFALPVLFPPEKLPDVLGEVIADNGLSQLRIAETEKYAHVTFFFNGGREEPFPGEERCLVPSPRDVKTYDLKPEMSAGLVTEELLKRLDKKVYDLIVLNFANCDMVGHTGNLPAVVKACETVDNCLGLLLERLKEKGIIALITADHGNAEALLDRDGQPITAHSTNPVPLIICGGDFSHRHLRPSGVLADIAPTVLQIMGLAQPPAMTGSSLL